jgi:hypothetical protein
VSSVQIEQKSYEMPPCDGFTVTHFITVADISVLADPDKVSSFLNIRVADIQACYGL